MSDVRTGLCQHAQVQVRGVILNGGLQEGHREKSNDPRNSNISTERSTANLEISFVSIRICQAVINDKGRLSLELE